MSKTTITEPNVQDIERRLAALAKHPDLGIYMDHNATTPLAPDALDAMLPYLTWNFGNASSIHEFGIQGRYGIEKARVQVAKLVNAVNPEDIVFTGCGSESDNIAIRCTRHLHPDRKHIVTTAVEHKAILEACREMEADGYEVTYLPVGSDCKVTAQAVANAIRPDTLLASIMFANNETGVIQPIAEIAALCRERGVIFHSDSIQAIGRLKIDVQELGADLLSMSGHKLYGPKGVGALYIRPGLDVKALVVGGSQERGVRAGTENVAGAVGFGQAAKTAGKALEEEAVRLTTMRRRLWSEIEAKIPDVSINGDPDDRLPGTLNLCFRGMSGQRLVTEMNAKGVAISAGSACTSVGTSHSHVLIGMGMTEDDAVGSVRIALGRANEEKHVDYVMGFLPKLVEELRAEYAAEKADGC